MTNRWRVKRGSQDYTDQGPDLLRTKTSAQRELAAQMGAPRQGWYLRLQEDWSEHPFRKAEVLQRYETWQRGSGDGARFRVGRKEKGDIVVRTESTTVRVKEVNLPNVNPGATLVADLARTQFGCQVGGFACREYNDIPGSGWSDHAWGDAVDLWGPPNDRLTDWCVRMGRNGLMNDVAQFIGSRDGKVGSFYAPAFTWNAGGPSSHLTHVHCSYRQHFGRDPNCS